jgi:hypothetical protein
VGKKKKADATSELVDQFLGSFAFDDVELDDWVACHESLDVHISVKVPHAQLASLSTVTVEYCQVAYELNRENRYSTVKNLKKLQVEVPMGTVHLEKIIVKDQGDSKDGFFGRLLVTILAT